jgi:hypothetical protein
MQWRSGCWCCSCVLLNPPEHKCERRLWRQHNRQGKVAKRE